MARQIEVDPARRRAHPTLASAVAAAQTDDVIHVAPGRYRGPLVLHRRVHVVAAPGTVLVEHTAEATLSVGAGSGGSSVSGLHLVAHGDRPAVHVEWASVRLHDCVVEASSRSGVAVDGPGLAHLVACRITSSGGNSITVANASLTLVSCEVSTASGCGVYATGSQVALDGCRFPGVHLNGLNLDSSTRGTVRNCTFHHSRSDYPAVFVGAGGDVAVESCTFEELASDALAFADGARGTVEGCVLRSVAGNGVLIRDGSAVAVRNLAAVDVGGIAVWVESRSHLDLAGARIGGRGDSAVLVGEGSRGEVSDMDVSGTTQAAIALNGLRLTLLRVTVRDIRANALKVLGAGACEATELHVDTGEVDFPLVVAGPGSSLVMRSSSIRGGAEAAVHSAGSNLELFDVRFDEVGGAAVLAASTTATIECLTAVQVGVGLEVAGGCRLTAGAVSIEGSDRGVVVSGKAILRLNDTLIQHSRENGIVVEDAKAVLTATSVLDSGGDAVVVGEGADLDFRGVGILRSAGVGLRSATALTLPPGAVEFADNAKGDLEWPGRSARRSDRTVEELRAELDSLVGLDGVKRKIHSLLNLIRLRQREADLGRRSEPVTLHAVFTGPPGTGKTTVARLYGEFLHAMGLLENGRFYEVTRADLVVGFIGQTATNTRRRITEAMGGVLFIDEAYSLAQAGGHFTDFGEEAINELVPMMENHRADLAVIAAGYTGQMTEFLELNPGLRSRFATIIEFPDYSDDELMEILHRSLHDQDRVVTPGAAAVAARYFAALPRNAEFANGREVRKLLDAVVEAMANRLALSEDFSVEALSTVTEVDVRAAVVSLSG